MFMGVWVWVWLGVCVCVRDLFFPLFYAFPFLLVPPKSLVLFDIFVNILAHNLAEPAYDADVAQLEYKLVPGDHGLVIRLKGFNHKLPVRMCLGRPIVYKKYLVICL